MPSSACPPTRLVVASVRNGLTKNVTVSQYGMMLPTLTLSNNRNGTAALSTRYRRSGWFPPTQNPPPYLAGRMHHVVVSTKNIAMSTETGGSQNRAHPENAPFGV